MSDDVAQALIGLCAPQYRLDGIGHCATHGVGTVFETLPPPRDWMCWKAMDLCEFYVIIEAEVCERVAKDIEKIRSSSPITPYELGVKHAAKVARNYPRRQW